MAEPVINLRPRPLAIVGITACGILAGALVGGATNAVNGLVSPDYFRAVLRWQDIADVWRASIAQGILEGLGTGVVFALVFTIVSVHITGGACSFRFAFKHLLGIVGGVCMTWALGGLIAMGLATLSPGWFRHLVLGVPEDCWDMLRYAWVGGSSWGAQLGGFVSVVVGLVVLRVNWRWSYSYRAPRTH